MGQSYRDQIARQKAMNFVMDVYRTAKAFPRGELYGLASQLRRARLRFQAILRKGRRASHLTSSIIFSDEPEERWLRSTLS
jgi:four helix bundle protein